MIIPQFSIRWLLLVTAVVAAVSTFVGVAVRGSPWAWGVSIAVGSLVVVMAVHVLLFAVIGVFARDVGVAQFDPIVLTPAPVEMAEVGIDELDPAQDSNWQPPDTAVP